MVIILILKEFLKANKNARKVFGKKELEIIFKQLDGLLLKQSERNRISRDIKPKLEFIKEIAQFKDEFRLRNNQNNKKLIEHAVEIILDDILRDNIKAILLFGSFANNTFAPSSDIDICVIFRRDLSLKEATEFRIRVSGNLAEKIDIQVFNVLPQKIKREIAKNHKVLYRSNEHDNINFTIMYLKDEDYFIRRNNIFGKT